MSNRTFAQRLQAIIEADAELTPAGLAKRAGLDNSAIRSLLSGKAKNPRVDTAVKICSALGTTLEEFMADDFPGNSPAADEEARHIRNLLSQLTPEERVRLVTYGEGLRDARQMAQKARPQDPK